MYDDETERQLYETFDTLESRERRHTLDFLQDEGYASRTDIAAYLEGKTGRTETDLETALHHNHLPRMDERGWVDYDPQTGDVSDATINVDETDQRLLDYLDDTLGEDDDYLDTVFGMLKDGTNRRTMYLLETKEDGQSTLNGLKDHLVDVTDADPVEMKRTLHHKTLPILDDAGWVDYDPDSEKVSMTVDPDSLPFTYLDEYYGDDE